MREFGGGLNSVRANIRPFLLIQACAFAAVAAYYLSPAVHEACDAIAAVKASSGLVFSIGTMIVASVVFPELARRITGVREKIEFREIVFRSCFFAILGLIVDWFYVLLGAILGTGTNWQMVLTKVVVDQVFFSPFISIPYSTVAFLWRDEQFSFARTAQRLREGEFIRRYPKTLGMCWGYWLPALCAVYAMPVKLQFILFLFAQGAWSLLLVHISKSHAEAAS